MGFNVFVRHLSSVCQVSKAWKPNWPGLHTKPQSFHNTWPQLFPAMPPKSHLPKVQTTVDEAVCHNSIYMAKTHRSPPAKNRKKCWDFWWPGCNNRKGGKLFKTSVQQSPVVFMNLYPETTASWAQEPVIEPQLSVFGLFLEVLLPVARFWLFLFQFIQKMVNRTYLWAGYCLCYRAVSMTYDLPWFC